MLKISLDNELVGSVSYSGVPVDIDRAMPVKGGRCILKFDDSGEQQFVHEFDTPGGFVHLSVRISAAGACQTDCLLSDELECPPAAFVNGEVQGIRFQPFFLAGTEFNEDDLSGQGLMHRGLHFSGTVTPRNLTLSCICDQCQKSFGLISFHAGFNNCDYLYSDSGLYTLVIRNSQPGSFDLNDEVEINRLNSLEASLPTAPDGTQFRYLNPLKCPHCAASYVDFERFPTNRATEYYGHWHAEFAKDRMSIEANE